MMSDDGEEVIRDGWRGEIVDGYFFPIEPADSCDVAHQELFDIAQKVNEIFSRPSYANPTSGTNSEALRATGYRATDTTGMSLERNGARVSTRTEPQAKRQSDGMWTCVVVLLGIAATILGLAACRLADWISLYGV